MGNSHFSLLDVEKFKLQEDGEEGKGQRKENHDSVMANLNLLVFLSLAKGRDQTKGWRMR